MREKPEEEKTFSVVAKEIFLSTRQVIFNIFLIN